MQMRARFLAFIEDVRGSYWFLPSLFAVLGFGAGLLLVYIDSTVGDWMGRFEWFYGSRPEGARSLLSTVAGSTITVAGVVFSITLAAVTYASGQYGPRLLTYFVRDKGNQVTLGVFIGTFLYCLVVLRTIRSAEEASADTGGAVREAFVPHIALFGGMALTIMSIAVLIYFVHHVTDSIHINNVIARIGKGLLSDIAEHGRKNREQLKERGDDPNFVRRSPIASTRTGYIEAIDQDGLLRAASRHDVIFMMLVRPGDFVHRGQPLMAVDSAGTDGLDEAAGHFTVSRKRSALQDLRFPINELVEIAARALSPGVNDPFTAIACIDWIGAALSDLAAMPEPSRVLYDQQGRPRLIVSQLDYRDYLELAIGRLLPYAARDPNAAEHLQRTMDFVRETVANPGHRALLDDFADRARRESLKEGVSASQKFKAN